MKHDGECEIEQENENREMHRGGGAFDSTLSLSLWEGTAL